MKLTHDDLIWIDMSLILSQETTKRPEFRVTLERLRNKIAIIKAEAIEREIKDISDAKKRS